MLNGRYGQGQQVASDINFEIINIITTDNVSKNKLKTIATKNNNKTDKKVLFSNLLN